MRTLITSIFLVITGAVIAQNYSVTNFTTSNSAIASNNITAITTDPSDNIWVGTNGSGISKYDGSTWSSLTTTNGLVGNTVKGIACDDAGNIWIATTAGLSKYNGASFTNYTTAQGLASNDLRSIYVDNANNIWAGTAGAGVSKYNGASFTTYDTGDGLIQNFVLAITQDLLGNMWFGTATGVSKFTGSAWTSHTSLNGINTNGDQVQSATTDADGNVWVGSLPSMGIGGGLYKWNGASWTAFTTSNGLAHNDVRGIASDSQSRLWIATNVNGTSHYRNSTFTTYGTGAGLASAVQQCSAVDNNGYVWIGTTGGLSRIQTVVFHTATPSDAHCGNNDGSITLSIGTINAPLYYSYDNGTTYTTSATATGLVAGTYHVWYTDSSMFFNTDIVVGASTVAMDAIGATSYNLCDGDSMQPGVNTAFTGCLWTPQTVVSLATDPNPLISPPSNMWVYLTYSDTNGCPGEDSIQFFIMPTPNVFVNISDDSVFTSPLIFSNYQWFLYGDTIPGATGQSYTATQPGIYMLCANNSGQCTGCSDPINYQNEGIEEQNDWAHVFASEGELFWDLPEANCIISLHTIDGRLLQQFRAAEKTGTQALGFENYNIVMIHIQSSNADAWVKLFTR